MYLVVRTSYPALPLIPALLLTFASYAPAQTPDRDLSESSLEELMNIEVYSASRHLQETKKDGLEKCRKIGRAVTLVML